MPRSSSVFAPLMTTSLTASRKRRLQRSRTAWLLCSFLATRSVSCISYGLCSRAYSRLESRTSDKKGCVGSREDVAQSNVGRGASFVSLSRAGQPSRRGVCWRPASCLRYSERAVFSLKPPRKAKKLQLYEADGESLDSLGCAAYGSALNCSFASAAVVQALEERAGLQQGGSWPCRARREPVAAWCSSPHRWLSEALSRRL